MGALIPRGAVREIWEQGGLKGVPILVPPSGERDVWDAVEPGVRAFVLEAADASAGTPWPHPLLSQWAAYARTGDRVGYEAVVFARGRRLRLVSSGWHRRPCRTAWSSLQGGRGRCRFARWMTGGRST